MAGRILAASTVVRTVPVSAVPRRSGTVDGPLGATTTRGSLSLYSPAHLSDRHRLVTRHPSASAPIIPHSERGFRDDPDSPCAELYRHLWSDRDDVDEGVGADEAIRVARVEPEWACAVAATMRSIMRARGRRPHLPRRRPVGWLAGTTGQEVRDPAPQINILAARQNHWGRHRMKTSTERTSTRSRPQYEHLHGRAVRPPPATLSVRSRWLRRLARGRNDTGHDLADGITLFKKIGQEQSAR